MSRSVYGIVAAMLLLSLAAPVSGKNYQLHSPKLWSQQEKEQYEKENQQTSMEKELAEKQIEQLKKERENSEKQKAQLKKEQEQAEKQKKQLKKDIEQAEKQNALLIKEKIQAEKKTIQLKKDREQAEKQKELFKKEMVQAEQQKEQLKREREQINQQKVRLKEERERLKKENARVKEDLIQVKDGVSYREVTVQNGDTLFDISRKYRKEGSLYSETLRFNDIKDPDHIADGDIIKVPLFMEKKAKQKSIKPVAVAVKKQSVPAKANSTFPNDSTARQDVETRIPPKASLPQQQAFANITTSRQQLFEQAVKSYRSGDCQTAVQLFGRFLAEHPPSAMSADASLFIADCYMKLSGK